MEYQEAGGLPSTVTKTNPFPVNSRNVSQPRIIGAASNTAVTIANAPALLSQIDYFNNSGTETAYVKLYNQATPNSASTPVIVWEVFPYGNFKHVFPEPVEFTTAIGVRVTTDPANNSTASPTAGNIGNAFYRLS
jgi:hypothetical protein